MNSHAFECKRILLGIKAETRITSIALSDAQESAISTYLSILATKSGADDDGPLRKMADALADSWKDDPLPVFAAKVDTELAKLSASL